MRFVRMLRLCMFVAASALAPTLAFSQNIEDAALSDQPTYLRNIATGKCLEQLPFRLISAGTPSRIRTCDFNRSAGSPSFQKWRISEVTSGFWRIESSHRGTCLNIKASSQNYDSAEPRFVGCGNHPDQLWRIIPLSSDPTKFQFRSVSTGRCLNVHSGRENRDLGKVSVYTCAATPDQYWQRVNEDAAQILNQAER